jgi:integral membrane sensor domain MASE1
MVAFVSTRLAAASVAVTALVVVAVWLTDLSFERAILLAPVLVIGVGAVAGLLVFWGRVGWESFRNSRRPRLITALVLGFVLLLVVLTLLGVDLPREGG